MSNAFKPVWGLLAILVGVVAVVGLSRMLSPPKDGVVPWRSDFDAARAEAAQRGKPVFAYFTASWCGYCQRMQANTLSDRKVAAALAGYVPVKVDVDSAPAELKQRYLRTPQNLDGGIPAYRVIDANGEVRKEGLGELPPDEFVRWLNAPTDAPGKPGG